MGLTVLVDPTAEPVSLDEAKDHLRVSGNDDDDAYISGLIIAARQTIEDDTRRALTTQTLQYTLDDGWPSYQPAARGGRYGRDRSSRRNRIVLPRPPVQQVVSVNYFADLYGNYTVPGAAILLDPSYYTGRVLSTGEYALDETYGMTWPDILNSQDAATIVYIAGYSSSGVRLPEPLRIGLLMLVSQWYENRLPVNPNLRGEPLEMPNMVSSLVQRYRIMY